MILGSKTPRDCPSGSFTNTSRSSICQECPERYYCIPNNVTAGDPQSGYHACPRGYYCPPGKFQKSKWWHTCTTCMHHRHSDYASLYRNYLIFSSITQYHIWILRIIYEKIYLQYRLLRDN